MILKPCKPHHALLLTKVPLMIPISLRIIVKILLQSTRLYIMNMTSPFLVSYLSTLHSPLTVLVHSLLSSDSPNTFPQQSFNIASMLLTLVLPNDYISSPISLNTSPSPAALRSALQSLLSRKAFPRHGIRYSLPSFCIYSALFFP